MEYSCVTELSGVRIISPGLQLLVLILRRLLWSGTGARSAPHWTPIRR